MMGSSHALSGAALWVGGAAAVSLVDDAAGRAPGWMLSCAGLPGAGLAAFDLRPDAPTVLIGAIVCAGAALLPDIDCPGDITDRRGGSHAARAFGPLSRALAFTINRISRAVQHATRAPGEPRAIGGHRWLTHTAVFALALGAVVSGLALTPWGGWTAGTVLFVGGTLAARATLPWQMRSLRLPRKHFGSLADIRWPMSPVYGAILALSAWWLVGEAASWFWLGPAVAVGCVIHVLGDMVTDGGAPLLWPVRMNGYRWRRLSLALFATNSRGEALACGVLAALLLGSSWGMAMLAI